MKLSEAIRLGAMMRPEQAFGVLATKTSSCANGAAHDAFGVLDADGFRTGYLPDYLAAQWRGVLVACPACRHAASHIADITAHINNDHRWSRERIADWVESIECAQEQSTGAEHTQTVNAVDVLVES